MAQTKEELQQQIDVADANFWEAQKRFDNMSESEYRAWMFLTRDWSLEYCVPKNHGEHSEEDLSKVRKIMKEQKHWTDETVRLSKLHSQL